MDPQIVQQKDGKAFGTTGIQLELGYSLDSSYDLGDLVPTKIDGTGLLTVFTLTPQPGSGLSRFFGRWDGKAAWLDIDITETSRRVKRRFERGQGGYGGHHPVQLAGGSHRFQVAIRIPPDREVFRGVVSFGVERRLAVGDPITVADLKCETDVIRREPGAAEGRGNAERLG